MKGRSACTQASVLTCCHLFLVKPTNISGQLVAAIPTSLIQLGSL